MSRIRSLITAALLLISILLTLGTAAAAQRAPHSVDKAATPAQITWSPSRVTTSVAPGQSTNVVVTFTSNVALTNVTVKIPSALGQNVRVSPATITTVPAKTPTTLTLTLSMPASKAHNVSGNVQLWSGNKALGQP